MRTPEEIKNALEQCAITQICKACRKEEGRRCSKFVR